MDEWPTKEMIEAGKRAEERFVREARTAGKDRVYLVDRGEVFAVIFLAMEAARPKPRKVTWHLVDEAPALWQRGPEPD